MASPNLHTNGVGGTSGSTLATVSPLYTSGEIWYLHSPSGSDAASPRGKERIRPLATLAQALTNAGNNDIIVAMSGHTETLAAITTIAETGLSIIGEGTGSSRPQFIRNVNDELFDITGAGVMLDNLYFPASTTATALGKVRCATAGCIFRNLYFEASTSDDGPQLEFITGAGQALVEGCTFISTAASPADQPATGIQITNAMSDLWMDQVILDGGSSGWANPYALVGTGAVTRLRCTNLDLLRDSDVTLATGTVGYVHVRTKSGSARVVWAA